MDPEEAARFILEGLAELRARQAEFRARQAESQARLAKLENLVKGLAAAVANPAEKRGVEPQDEGLAARKREEEAERRRASEARHAQNQATLQRMMAALQARKNDARGPQQ